MVSVCVLLTATNTYAKYLQGVDLSGCRKSTDSVESLRKEKGSISVILLNTIQLQ